MVRAGVVAHPKEWIYSGFYELHCKQRRKNIIDEKLLASYLGFSQSKTFRKEYPNWINQKIRKERLQREVYWTESIAVGKESFLETVRDKLGIRGKQRKDEPIQNGNVLQEPLAEYEPNNFPIENRYLTGQNSYYLSLN
jgi:putative transposase